MPNLTFSREKNRELSQFEARVGSFRRRLSDPLGRKQQVTRAFPPRVSDPLTIRSAKEVGG